MFWRRASKEIAKMTVPLTLFGAPTSAASYAPGQEKAPRALREAGLVEALERAGLSVVDQGDLPVWRWRPDRTNRFAQNLGAVVDYVRRTEAGVRDIVGRGQIPLVLGGNCTLELGTVAGVLSHYGKVGLIYLDFQPDLNLPTSTLHGALDWMGMSHMLDVEGALPELSRFGPRFPLLHPADVFFCGLDRGQVSAWENQTLDRLNLRYAASQDMASNPEGVAADILEKWASPFERILVHFDVDVLDFFDAPLAENYTRNLGLTLDQAMRALGVFAADERFGGLTITEINPDHGEEGGATLKRFVEALAKALSQSPALTVRH
jgi:arginase